MANALYDAGREAFLTGAISWSTDNIRINLLDGADYTPNLATDDFLADIPGVAIVDFSSNLTTKTTTAGVADSDNVTFSSVTGDECELISCYKETGVAATSNLIFLLDTAGGVGFPITPNGGDITVTWGETSDRIFKL